MMQIGADGCECRDREHTPKGGSWARAPWVLCQPVTWCRRPHALPGFLIAEGGC